MARVRVRKYSTSLLTREPSQGYTRSVEDEGKRRAEVATGLKVARFANDDVFRDAVARVRLEYLSQFEKSTLDGFGDYERKMSRMGLDALQRLVSDLQKDINTGKMAEAQLVEHEEQDKACRQHEQGSYERNLHRVA